MLHLVRVEFPTPGKTVAEETLRLLAETPPPVIDGVRARWWRAERHRLVGRYLVTDPAVADRLSHDADPMADALLGAEQGSVSVRALPTSSSTMERPVFIVSAPRTGSTLLHELLALAHGVTTVAGGSQAIFDGVPELHVAARGYVSQRLGADDASPDIAETIQAAFMAALWPEPGEAPMQLVDACVEHCLRLDFLEAVFPSCRYIFLRRDLRQNISSMVEAWHRPGFAAYRRLPGFGERPWCFLLPEGWSTMTAATSTRLAAFQWEAANRNIVEKLDATPRERWTTVDYDGLVAQPRQEIDRLCAFIGIEPGPRLTAALSRPLPLSSTTVNGPSPVKWRTNPDFDPRQVRHLQPLAGIMRTLDTAVSRTVLRSAHPTDVRFANFLSRPADDEVSDHAPQPAHVLDEVDVGSEIVSEGVRVQLGSSPPLEVFREVPSRERFLEGWPLIWAQDPGFGIWTPFWAQRADVHRIRTLLPGHPPPDECSGPLRANMLRAGILTTERETIRRRQECSAVVQQGPGMFARDRLLVVPQLLGSPLTRALGSYYRTLIETGDWPLGDDQVDARYGWHDEHVAQFLHRQLPRVISDLVGFRVKPTYSYTSAYRGGAELHAHTDREQCELTLSVLVDERRPHASTPWPLWFRGPNGPHSVTLEVGDGVLFRGCEIPHWREAAVAEHEQINLLFHFVPSQWRGVLC